MTRKMPVAPFPTPATLDLSGEALIVSAPVTYEEQDLKGRPRHHLATTNVRIPIASASEAPVIGTWRFENPTDGVSDIAFRSHGGRAYYCERDTPYREISIELLAIGQDPAFWRRLMSLSDEADFTMGDGYPLSFVDVTNHPFRGYDQLIDNMWAQKDAFVRDYNAKEFSGDEPDYLVRAERVRQEAARYLIVDGRIWTRTIGPTLTKGRGGQTQWSDRMMKASAHHSLEDIFQATRIEDLRELWRRHFDQDLAMPAGEAPVISDPLAFTWPIATAAALDYAFGIAIRANKRPTSEMDRGLAIAVAGLREAFEAAFPNVEWLWRSHTYERQWASEIDTFEEPVDIGDITAAAQAAIDAMPDLPPAYRKQMKAKLAVHRELAAREFARFGPLIDPDEADLSALSMPA